MQEKESINNLAGAETASSASEPLDEIDDQLNSFDDFFK